MVRVYFLGGTISMAGGSDGVISRLGADDLVADVPGLAAYEIAPVDWARIPSASLRFADLLALLRDAAAHGGPTVVVQGTDTIEETAFLFDLLWDSEAPLVVTGAMRNPTLAGPDGPANLLAAVTVAASADARGLGALVVMNEEIHAARYVGKWHTSNAAAFVSGGYGPLGHVVEGRAVLGMRVERRKPLAVPARLAASVPIVSIALGDDGMLLGALGQADGVVISGVGGGHVPEHLAERIGLLAQGIPVVLATRTGAGPVLTNTYGARGAEIDLIARGLIPAGELDPYKARILLAVLLANGADRETIGAAFEDR